MPQDRRSTSRPHHYVLGADARTPRPATFEEWALSRGWTNGERPKSPRPGDGWARVAEDRLGELYVSTVFMGLDHNFWGEGPPLLFETMIFGSKQDEWQWRYSTWEEAEAGHTRALAFAAFEVEARE